MNNKYVLGLDIGITSIGWSIIDEVKGKLLDMGVHMFEQATPAQEARLNRSARRTLRRRNWRKKQLKNAFIEFGLISKEEMNQRDYLSYTANSDTFTRPEEDTVYHLRLKALNDKVSLRELLLCLYNICGTRGHFLMENINFASSEPITFDFFVEQFYEFAHAYVNFTENTKEFEKTILKPIFEKGKVKSNELKSLLKDEYTVEAEDNDALLEILKLICGFKCDLKKISESVVLVQEDKTKDSVKLDELLKLDNLNEFLNNAVELHDVIAVSQILKDHNYICEVAVEKLNEVLKVQKLEHSDPDKYKEEKKIIQSKMSKAIGERLRVVKNMENKYPNGLYVKEASDILHKQQQFYPNLITDNFIEACISTIKARIPYYIGPLSSQAKNSWINRKDGTFKYGYDYCKDALVNEEESIQNWKLNMISHCTYLPEEYALPKGSFIAETFSLLNELNILTAIDKDENRYYLTREDKLKVFDELFLKRTDYVSHKEVAELLNLKSFGPKDSRKEGKFKNRYTLYQNIISVFPQFELHSILDLFNENEKEKVDKIEDIILNLNLFDEEQSKVNYFTKKLNLDNEDAKKLARCKSNGFYAFSKQFIMEIKMNVDGETLLEEMLRDNSENQKNEQMTLITEATDLDGNRINFDSNKYMTLLKDTKKLSIDLLIQDGKPFIPIARPVIRALNECFKLYEEVVNTYGVPDRVVIETARDLKDSAHDGDEPAKHFDQMKNLYDYLTKQMKEQKDNAKISKHYLEDWDVIQPYLEKNKRKVELYIRQNGRDMVTGDEIDIQKLEDYEMDHILPRGFGDNSMDNLMLIRKEINGKKADRLPLEYIEAETVTNQDGKHIISSDFKRRCYELNGMKLISDKKLKRLLLASTDEAMGFINRNLVDTRYIIRELMAILRAYNAVNNYDTHIVSLRSSFTTVYRNAFNMKKNRDIGDQHHAHDASIVAIADMVLSTYYPNYDERGNNKYYQEFLKRMMESQGPGSDKSENQKLYGFIKYAYFKRFGNYPNDNDSLVSQVKDTVPLYSIKAEKNYKGAFFDATIYPQMDKKKNILREKSVLGLLGVNNDKRIYSSINCVAVDFFKYRKKNGKKAYVGIQIPKLIVNNNGEINKELYIKLIRDYYKVPELLDENGNVKEYYFRMRVYKNDLFYETESNTVLKFGIGTITRKILEPSHVYCFSYNDIYKEVYFLRKEMAIRFDFKEYIVNPSGHRKFNDYAIDELLEFCLNNYLDLDDLEKQTKLVINKFMEMMNKQKSKVGKIDYQWFLETIVYLNLIVNRKCSPLDRYRPGTDIVKKNNNEDAQYIKIKSSILGIRYTYNENGKLLISGPRKAPGKYSKIKKEKFSWKICSDVLQ